MNKPDLKQTESVSAARALLIQILGGLGIPEHWYASGDAANRATAAEIARLEGLRLEALEQRFEAMLALGLLALSVPLALAIGLISGLLAFIPFFGALVGGGLAVLMLGPAIAGALSKKKPALDACAPKGAEVRVRWTMANHRVTDVEARAGEKGDKKIEACVASAVKSSKLAMLLTPSVKNFSKPSLPTPSISSTGTTWKAPSMARDERSGSSRRVKKQKRSRPRRVRCSLAGLKPFSPGRRPAVVPIARRQTS